MYDPIYNFLEGWTAYAKNANTHNLRRRIIASFEEIFPVKSLAKRLTEVGLKRKNDIQEKVINSSSIFKKLI